MVRTLKRILAALIVVTVALSFTACDSYGAAALAGFKATCMDSVLANRIGQNINMAEDLKTLGLITEEECKTIKDYLQDMSLTLCNGKSFTTGSKVSSVDTKIEEGLGNPAENSKDGYSAKVTKTLFGSIVGLNTPDRYMVYPEKPEGSDIQPEPYEIEYTFTNGSDGSINEITGELTWSHGGKPQKDSAIGALLHKEAGLLLNSNGKTKIVPVQLIGATMAKTINERLSLDVYVIKDASLISAEGIGTDELMETIKEAETSNKSSILEKYFVNSNTSILDTTLWENQLVVTTGGVGGDGTLDENGRPVEVSTQTKRDDEDPNIAYGNANGAITGQKLSDHEVKEPLGEYEQKLGLDLKISELATSVLSMRLVEFNQFAYDNIRRALGTAENRYMVIDKKIFLMEYPVHVVKEIEEASETTFTTTFRESDVHVNLKTGKLLVGDGGGGYAPMEYGTESPYYSMLGAAGSASETMSSLSVFGTAPTVCGVAKVDIKQESELKVKSKAVIVDYEEKFKAENLATNGLTFYGYSYDGTKTKQVFRSGDVAPRVTMETGRIVLRDYLEGTYAPGVVDGVREENIVAFGRKLRIVRFGGNKDDVFALFYDSKGVLMEGTPQIYVSDICDIDRLMLEEKVYYIKGSAEQEVVPTTVEGVDENGQATDVIVEEGTDGEAVADGLDGYLQSSVLIGSLPIQTTDRIAGCIRFPSSQANAASNIVGSQKPVMFMMALKLNPFETALYTSWITNESQENSLTWWNKWCTEVGYNYNLNPNIIADAFKGNHGTGGELPGSIILDTETIKKIQKEYSLEDSKQSSRTARTLYISLGVLLIFASIVVVALWVLDTNIDIGANLLGKVSFGKWTAIKYKEDIPEVSFGDTKYVSFGSVIKLAFVMMIIGIMLLTVDVITIVSGILSIVVKVATWVINTVFGG